MIKDLDHICANKDASIMSIVEKIDKGALQLVLIVDSHKRLLATVTDGDIRRALLKGIGLHQPITCVMNKNPITVENKMIGSAAEIMEMKKINHLPIIDADGKLVGLELLNEFSDSVKKKTWVVIMAGGLGTRLRPLTNEIPKPMLSVGGRPLLETIIRNFKSQGFTNFFLSVNYRKEVIQSYFRDGREFGATIEYLEEDSRMGTAGSLSLINQLIREPLILINGDVMTTMKYSNLLNYHEDSQADITVGVKDYSLEIPFGVSNSTGSSLHRIEEKPVKTFQISAGIYVLAPSIIDAIPKLKRCDMPSVINECIDRGMKAEVFPIREYWLDIGRFDDLQRAESDFSKHLSFD